MSSVTQVSAHERGARLPSRLTTKADSPVPFGRLVRTELRKSVDTRAGRWLLAAIGVLTLAVLAVLTFTGDVRQGHDLQDFVQLAWLPQNILLPVLGIMLVTAEWSQRTGLTTFTLEPRRGLIGWAKLAASWVLGVAVVVVGLVSAALATLLVATLRGGDPSWSVSWQVLLGVLVGELVAVSMGVAFGLILQNTPLAIVAYFLIPTVWTALGSSVAWLQDASQWLDTQQTLSPLVDGTLHGDGWAKLATSIAVWVVLPMAAGLWRLRRSEVK